MMLDSTVIIATLKGERGAIDIESGLEGKRISIINLTEVFHAARRRGVETTADEIERSLVSAGMKIVFPTIETARLAADFMSTEPPKGRARISLGDGYCLAHAFEIDAPVLTADRSWAEMAFPHPVKVELIR